MLLNFSTASYILLIFNDLLVTHLLPSVPDLPSFYHSLIALEKQPILHHLLFEKLLSYFCAASASDL